jgi:hypothetical protein
MANATEQIVLSSQENNFVDFMKTNFSKLYFYSENDISSMIQNVLNLLNILSKDELYAEHISKEFDNLGQYLNKENIGDIQELFRQQNIVNPTNLLVGGKRKIKSNNRKIKKGKNSKTKKGGVDSDDDNDDMIIPYQERSNQELSLEQTYGNIIQTAQTPAQAQIAIEAIKSMVELKKMELQQQHKLTLRSMDDKQKEKAQEVFDRRIQLFGVPSVITGIIGYAVNSWVNLFIKPSVSVASNTLGFLDKALSFVSMNKIQTTMGENAKDLLEDAGLAPALIVGSLVWIFMFLIMVLAFKVQKSDISVPFVSVRQPQLQRDPIIIEELQSLPQTRRQRTIEAPVSRARSTARTRREQLRLQNGGKRTRKYKVKHNKHKNRSRKGKITRKYRKQRKQRLSRKR